MTNYRRNRLPGGTFFFTVALANRRSTLLIDEIAHLRHAVGYVRIHHPFEIVAWVVMPDHLHAVWTLPQNDDDYAMRWRQIKATFSRRIGFDEERSASRTRSAERGIWQRRYWEHTVRDDLDLARHIEYVHYNPVKHGHVARVCDWPYSTFHRYVRNEIYPADWGGEFEEPDGRYGEVE
jgi:putative transposase